MSTPGQESVFTIILQYQSVAHTRETRQSEGAEIVIKAMGKTKALASVAFVSSCPSIKWG